MYPSKNQVSTNLLATCKQVYDEAARYPYGQPFVFYNTQAAHIFLLNMRPTTISLLKDIELLRIHSIGINNNALLSGLRHATNLTAFRLGGRVTAPSDKHLRLSEKRIGSEIAARFYFEAAYFIRNFIAVRGVDDLLQVVQFNEEDLRGDEFTRLQHRWTEARKDAIMDGIKAQLMRNLRVRAQGRVPKPHAVVLNDY